MPSIRTLSVIAGGAAMLLLAAYAGMNGSQNFKFKFWDQPAGAMPASSPKAVTVEAEPVRVDTVVETIQAVGTLLPNETVTVTSEIAGRIAGLPFREGDRVDVGQVLVELDASILQAEFDKAQSDLLLAEQNQTRAVSLADRGAGTFRLRDEAVAAHRAATANLALAKARLDKTRIAAPLSGRIGLRSVSIGAFVTPGAPIVALSDTDIIKVDFRVPELLLTQVKTGQAIRLTVDALPGQSFEGEIYVIDPIVDANGRALRLRARVPNQDARLSPGLFARIQIVIDHRDNAVLVPESAVFIIDGTQFVYRAVQGQAKQTEVQLGLRRPGWVEIRDGLERDAIVVTAGHQQIKNGSPLVIAQPRKGT